MKGLFTEMHTEQQWIVKHAETGISGITITQLKRVIISHLSLNLSVYHIIIISSIIIADLIKASHALATKTLYISFHMYCATL